MKFVQHFKGATVTLISILFQCYACEGQQIDSLVISYYSHVHSAELEVIQGDTISAIYAYDRAFTSKFPFLIDLNNAIDLRSSTLIDTTLSNLLDKWENIKTACYSSNGIKFEDLLQLELSRFKWSENTEKYFTEATCRKQYHERLQKLFDSDQELRKSKTFSNRDSVLEVNGIFMFNELNSLIQKYGWPKPQVDGIYNVLIYPLILHGTYYCGLNPEYKDFLKSQVFEGNLNSHFFAKINDRYLDWNLNKPQYYGEWMTTLNGTILIDSISCLDKRRFEIFLEPYREYCLKNSLSLPEGYE